MRIVFMGTPEFAVPTLRALIGSSHELIAVYTQPPRPAGRGMKLTPSPVQLLAEQHGIPVHTPTSLKTPEAQQAFAALQADCAVVVAYGLLLPQAILDAPRFGCINVHPSRLPRWRGAAPIQRTIMAGDADTEICIMQMDAGLDTGPVFLRSAPIAIPADTSAGALHDALATQAAPLVLQVLDGLPLTPVAQAVEGVTYAHKITKDECKIDWTHPAQTVLNHIRGLSPSPAAHTFLNGEMLKIHAAEVVNTPTKGAGITLDDRLTIGCGEGAIRLRIVQKAGKPKMSAEEFLRGAPVAAGTQL